MAVASGVPPRDRDKAPAKAFQAEITFFVPVFGDFVTNKVFIRLLELFGLSNM